ncbi:MAG: MoaD/ThiS family protein [Candidatus Poseidoniaceae archaeon]|jgi:molybdopterin converting factor small subunit|nr:MoaD/ThiS family protein [Candidatus Poseidoniaceae archaeon]MDP7203623.1 MoaD/ThiS family protein [Candidatus Poseidoniaceae archaeon]
MQVNIICFGPLAEQLGWKSRTMVFDGATTPRMVVEELGISNWMGAGLTFAIDGEMCSAEAMLNEGSELALLPPVSGG